MLSSPEFFDHPPLFFSERGDTFRGHCRGHLRGTFRGSIRGESFVRADHRRKINSRGDFPLFFLAILAIYCPILFILLPCMWVVGDPGIFLNQFVLLDLCLFPSFSLLVLETSVGRECGVGSVVVGFGSFGAPRFSVQRSQKPLS